MSDQNTNAVLDTAHVGDIRGAFGTISHGDTGPRTGLPARLKTLLAILGPGLIVMVGDNDAGAFSTYAQAGQNYGTSLLWTLALLIPVLYVNQEMVLRLGAVTGVGHARLILERFGKFWGAFSVIDLFVLNALTIITEFIGISLGLDFLGVPKIAGVAVAAVLIVVAAGTGDFRRFERFAMTLVVGSLLLIPLFLMIHPPLARVAHDLAVPQLPAHAALSEVMLLIIGIVGTTVAPWQLFFQQSYVIDKRITPRFIRYERLDLWLGIVLVMFGAIAVMACIAQVFEGAPEAGNFVDSGTVAAGIAKYYGRVPGILFAIALIDASIIGAAAISLSSAYAIGDVFSVKHSLHRKPSDAKGFYAVYCVLIVAAAALVLIPGMPLGLLTNTVQTLAGVLLPSAVVFLLLLCNDEQVLGPWVNNRLTNLVTIVIVGILLILSVLLTASILFPALVAAHLTPTRLLNVMIICAVLALLIGFGNLVMSRIRKISQPVATQLPVRLQKPTRSELDHWRMPPLEQLRPLKVTLSTRIWMGVLRGYLVAAALLVICKVILIAFQ